MFNLSVNKTKSIGMQLNNTQVNALCLDYLVVSLASVLSKQCFPRILSQEQRNLFQIDIHYFATVVCRCKFVIQ